MKSCLSRLRGATVILLFAFSRACIDRVTCKLTFVNSNSARGSIVMQTEAFQTRLEMFTPSLGFEKASLLPAIHSTDTQCSN
jgi:hypothetical protein